MTLDILLLVFILIVPLLAQLKINSNYSRYKKVENSKQITGAQVARLILDRNNLTNVSVVLTSGNLTDHYDPRKKVVSLSNDIYNGTSLSSISVAAHECGHAIQDQVDYVFLQMRSAIYPLVNLTTSLSYWILIIGFLFELINLVYIGIAFTCLGLLFQIITLPVEFNASKRAMKLLNEYQIITEEENYGAKNVLSAAALTYVAGTLASAAQILRLILLSNKRR